GTLLAVGGGGRGVWVGAPPGGCCAPPPGGAKTRRRAKRKAAPPVAECAVRVRPSAQARAGLGGICRRVPGTDDVRWAAPGADRSVLVWRGGVGGVGGGMTQGGVGGWAAGAPPPGGAPGAPAPAGPGGRRGDAAAATCRWRPVR